MDFRLREFLVKKIVEMHTLIKLFDSADNLIIDGFSIMKSEVLGQFELNPLLAPFAYLELNGQLYRVVSSVHEVNDNEINNRLYLCEDFEATIFPLKMNEQLHFTNMARNPGFGAPGRSGEVIHLR